MSENAASLKRALSAALTSIRNLEYSRKLALEKSDRLQARVRELENDLARREREKGV